ncbi:hypothetical protein ScPMuIL_009293 [Solemya velum]
METQTQVEPGPSDRLSQHMSLESYLKNDNMNFGDNFMRGTPSNMTNESSSSCSVPDFMQTIEQQAQDQCISGADEESIPVGLEGELTTDFNDESFGPVPDFDDLAEELQASFGVDSVDVDGSGDIEGVVDEDDEDYEEGDEEVEEAESGSETSDDDDDGENSGEETDSYVGDDESGVSKNGMQSQDGDMESVQSSQDLICPGDDNDYEETGSSSIVQTNTESNQGTTKKRKRKPKKPKDGKTKKKKKVKKEGNHRKNIRKILEEQNLDASTLEAQQEELERQKRLKELKEMYVHIPEPPIVTKKPEKDSELKSLLQAAETDASDRDRSDDVIFVDKTTKKVEEPQDVIELSSDEDDVVMLPESNEDNEVEDEDPNNGGSHINDALNRADERGNVLVNLGHPADDPDIFLPRQIARMIKPHQIGGVRFLYDNLIESLGRYKTSAGFGCILAHSMGLGKTIQMISFINTFLTNTTAKRVLCVVPINTLQNWNSEFDRWIPTRKTESQTFTDHNGEIFDNPDGDSDVSSDDTDYRTYHVFLLNETYKTVVSRAKLITEWYQTGGVLLIGYEMYRLLSSRKVSLGFPKLKKSKKAQPFMIDLDEEDKNKAILQGLHAALVNPGPDLVVCDEGHRIKNSLTGISQSLKMIRTRRRVALTGYPLQNNMIEYWCMVDFVRPNFLGTKTEFSNMFERPISNAQCMDSTIQDLKLMRYRAHVLHSLLEGFVQRRGHTVLQHSLPPKMEFVLLIRLSPIQRDLYKAFINCMSDSSLMSNCNPLKAFAVCCKIWNHPDVLHKIINKNRISSVEDNDLDIEDSRSSAEKAANPIKKRVVKPKPIPSGFEGFSERKSEQTISYYWAEEIMKDYQPGLLEMGGKFVILFDLLEHTIYNGEKILVFSQSLFTLNLIEDFLSMFKVPRADMDENWCKNKSYFRLDGSTSAVDREKMINAFNAEDNDRLWLFLLSTRAGSLGVNLIGANRVIVLDASWNPCHDCQAICRVYRFGQNRPTFIYRLVTENTLEKKIYERQIKKQGMSDRVIDEMNPENKFTRGQIDKLLEFQDTDPPVIDFSTCNNIEDLILSNVLMRNGHWLTTNPFTHESLLIDRKELRLTKREKQMAKQSYMMEKRMNISYTRPSYTSFYPKIVRPRMPRTWTGIGGRPIASVKPMVSTPVPMHPKGGSVNNLVRPGVSIHQVITTTEITLPGKTTVTDAGDIKANKIPSGSKVHVIKTPKGVYLRTTDGKIFAVRSKSETAGTTSNPLASICNSRAVTKTTAGTARIPVTHTVAPTKDKTETSSDSDIIPPISAALTPELPACSGSDLSAIFKQTEPTDSQTQVTTTLATSYLRNCAPQLPGLPVPTQFQGLLPPTYPSFFQNPRLPVPMNLPTSMGHSTSLLTDIPRTASHNDILTQLSLPDPITTPSAGIDTSKLGRTGVIKPQPNFSSIQPPSYLDPPPNRDPSSWSPHPSTLGQHHGFPFSPYSFPLPSPLMFPTGIHQQGGMNSTNMPYPQGLNTNSMPPWMPNNLPNDLYSSLRLHDLANFTSNIGSESLPSEGSSSSPGDMA